MSDNINPASYNIADDEKTASVMAYIFDKVIWGDIIIKKRFYASHWLKSNTYPDYLTFYNAKIMRIIPGETPSPLTMPEVHLATSQILVFHLVPPAQDPLDYDPKEPNLRFEPVTVLIGSFQINGKIQMGLKSSVERHMNITKEGFTTIYEAKIFSPPMPKIGMMNIPYLIVRKENAIFANRV